MQPAEILVQLRRVLSPTDVPTVLMALTAEPLVWKALQQPEFLQTVLSDDNAIVSSWSPANLALRPITNLVNPADLAAEHIPGIETSLRKKVLELLETTLRTGQSVASLEQAGLLALALRERRRNVQSWRGFLAELQSVSSVSTDELTLLWRTPLTCLYGMIPDTWDFLESLLPQDSLHPAIDWISHVLLTNPMDKVEQVKLFHDLMSQLMVEYQVEWLRMLAGSGHFTLAAGIADRLLITDHEFLASLDDMFIPDHATWVSTSRKILENQLAATLNQIAGRKLQAGIYLDKTRKLLHHWLAGATIQMAAAGSMDEQVNTRISADYGSLAQLMPLSAQMQTEAIFSNPVRNDYEKLVNLASSLSPQAGQKPTADENTDSEPPAEKTSIVYAQGLAQWLDEIERNPAALAGQFVYDWNPLPVLDDLTSKGHLREALQAAERFLVDRPEDTALLGWLADTCHSVGEDEKSVNFRLAALMLHPEEPEPVRKLAEIWEDRQDWNSALVERRKVVELTEKPLVNDQLALAACAISAGDFDQVNSTCASLLDADPDHGMAYALLGKAALVKGDLDSSVDHLSRAIMLIPEEAMPWFELAEAYRRKGDAQKRLETLRSAVLTAPDSSELHYSLGKAYLENNQISDALPFLRQSARLAPESVQIALELADTLTTLGYKQEALDVVEKARLRWRVHDELAAAHARLLFKEGKLADGQAVLEIALQSENPKADWYILYALSLAGEARTFLSGGSVARDKGELEKAQAALQKALAIQPQHFEARLTFAEVQLMRGEFEQAFGSYSRLIEAPEAVKEEWYWRTQAGLGRAALSLGLSETALASLQNAVTACPDSEGLNQLLAEAFQQANLMESAIQAADHALELAPDKVGMLTWHASQMAKLGQLEKAVHSLHAAVATQPENLDLRVTLADTMIEQGDLETSRKELDQIVENPATSLDQLRLAAKTFQKMDDSASAAAALEKAVAAKGETDSNLLFELAGILNGMDKYDQALEWIQKAIHNDSSDPGYFVFQSDLLDQLGRTPAALASLEKAFHLVEENSQKPAEKLIGQKPDGTDLIAGIHQRFTQLYRKVDDLTLALDHAEKTVQIQPDNLEFRFIAAELAYRLLQTDCALALAVVDDKSVDASEPNEWIAGIEALQCETAMEAGNYALAGQKVQSGMLQVADHGRFLAARVRTLLHEGEHEAAKHLFDELWQRLKPAGKNKLSSVRLETGAKYPLFPDSQQLALAEAAIDLSRWSEASQLLECVVKQQPGQPLALLRQARMLVKAAEFYLTGLPLGCEAHLPEEFAIGEVISNRFCQTIAELQKLSKSPEIERWHVRGEAVFHPAAASIRGFSAIAMTGEDAAALVLALNRTGNAEGAAQVAAEYASHAAVGIQMAMVEVDGKPELNQQAAIRAAAVDPYNPVCHIALAKTSQKIGDSARALEAVETALSFWSEEAGWQRWAAELARQSNDLPAARDHLEKTLALIPADLNVALELGRVYQKLEDYPHAVSVLSRAVQIAPNNAMAWLDYGQALFENKQLTEALKAASQAAQQADENTYKALVLSGEILLAAGDDRKAMDFARDAEKIAPSSPEVRLLTAKILLHRGKEKEALAGLTKAVADLPGVLALESERARLIYKLNGSEAAVQVLQPLAVQHPDNDQLISLFAAALAECGRTADAEKAAQLALRLNPEKSEIHLLLGRLYADTNQLDQSVHHLSEAARISPHQIDAYLDLGRVYTTRRDFPQALSAYQQAMHTAPEDYRAYYQAGLILRDSKDYQAAEGLLRRAAALAPADVNIRRQLGAIIALNLVHNTQEANSWQ